ncbi:hypothetical protein [Burkholderia ubonensis]|uniref:hypothetical protein n=1 Tax=Burkholderia ubonensis TaxID=101571 RepID=UPI00075A26EA|nr:hypothetical protein [Burkholderia ubonensis]
MNRYTQTLERLETAISLYKANNATPAHLSIDDLQILLQMGQRLLRYEPSDGEGTFQKVIPPPLKP